MEMNPRRLGKYHEQIVSKLEKEEQGSEDQLQGRAYTCSFCKRGFSNAQALGGHMNIHRKDRAKLRLTSEEDDDDQSLLLQHSVEDMQRKKINDALIHPHHHHHHPSADHQHQLELTDHDDQDKEYCCTAGIEKLHHHQLSLFSEKPTQSYDQSPIYCSAGAGGHDQERIIRHTHPPSSLKELDLELRLGPEPGP